MTEEEPEQPDEMSGEEPILPERMWRFVGGDEEADAWIQAFEEAGKTDNGEAEDETSPSDL